MEMRKLPLDEMREIYDLRMREDFPDNERRPFSGIAVLYEKGEYEGWGLCEGKDLLAYAFLVKEIWQGKPCCLVDYIAVDRDRRGEGIGTCLLKELKKALAGADCVIGEVENPDYARTPEEKAEMERRLRFYLRNGLRDTGACEWLYHVEYRLLELPLSGEHTRDEIFDIAEYFYRRMLPDHLVDRYLRIHR
ncbi:MAG: GNAT family N-acetyltransferase [Lachnospiraceae bacterium]|nr:GNAT family N-acetyltransferase [Lachnospiraceae bacterium]MBQ3974446.1 GNAT family N-acetyltransferase [Lachnospiraceae bacterium]MBQ4302966.1 GNAT family N-acetyltransferase [Lachnospiraceae bacterium]MBQ5359511.1 GNAT family N-acetyltransferase [Lachnospiraceae bacterium]